MSRAHSLYRLQQIDLALDRNQARMEQILAILADDEQIRRASQSLAEVQIALMEKQQAMKACESAVARQRDKIGQTEKTLYSGSISNPKELQDLQMEADSLKRYLSVLEDNQLEAMLDLEQVEEEHRAADDALQRLMQQKEAQHKELYREKETLLAEIERLQGDREAALASVSADDLAFYIKLREKHHGIAVALLESGNCSICGLAIHASLVQTINSGVDLVQCNQCKRIIYSG